MRVKKYVMVLLSMTILLYNTCQGMVSETVPLIATPTSVRETSLFDFTNVNTAPDDTYPKTTERKNDRDIQESARDNKETKASYAEYAIGVNHKARREKGSGHKYLDPTEGGHYELNRRSCAFTPDGKSIVIAFRQQSLQGKAYDNNVELHQVATGKETDFGVGIKSARAIACNPEGTLFAFVQPYSIELWSSQKVLIQKIVTKAPSFCLDSASDGQRLAREIFYAFMSFSEDGKKFFAITGLGKQLTLCTYGYHQDKFDVHKSGWRLLATQPINQVLSQNYYIISILPDGNLLVATHAAPIKFLAIVNPVTDKFIRTIDTPEKVKVGIGSVSVGGDYIVDAGYKDNNFKIIEFKTRKVVLTGKLAPNKEVRTVQLSPDYEHVLINYEDGTVTLMKIKKLEKQSPSPVNFEDIPEITSQKAPDDNSRVSGKCIVM